MLINWNVSPVITKIGFFELRYYSMFFALGLLLSYFLFVFVNNREKMKSNSFTQNEIDDLSIMIFLGTAIGARLGHCLFYDFTYYSKHIFEIFLPFGFDGNGKFVWTGYQGLASHGGAIGIFIAILLFCKKYKKNILTVLDKICLVVPIASGFIRLGNLMNSEIIGKPTDSNFGFIFKMVDKIPRHPTQIYESFGYFFIFLVLLKVYKNEKILEIKGKFFGLFLFLVFSFRFFIEFFKENQSVFENGLFINMGQILSLPFIFVGIYLFFRKDKK